MKVEAFRWGHGQSLAEHYVNDFSRIQQFYEYNPWDEDAWVQRARWLDQQGRFTADRAQLVKVLDNYNERVGNTPQAMANIRTLLEERTLTIVGGQQAGLFTGPLYVIHKAITLIQSAKQAAERLGRPVVPIFWIAGEDHDFDEVNHMAYLSQQQDIEKIKIDHPTGMRASVSRLSIPQAAWEQALNQLDQSLMQTEFKAGLMEKLSSFSQSSETFSEYFARMMAWLFGPHGLVLVDSDDPSLRQIEGPMFKKLVEEQAALNEAHVSMRKELEQQGYHAQADVQAGNANLFAVHKGERLLLQRSGDGFADKKGSLFFSAEELVQITETSPERLSNNVMTRPLMQEYIFPVLGTVLGQGEIAYWGLTRQAFEALGMKMPILIPRLQFTLLEGTIQKHMNKYDLSFGDIIERFDAKKKAWLDEQDTLRLEERFAQAKKQFTELYEPILETVKQINPGMGKLGDTNHQKIIEQIEFLQARSTDAYQAQFDAAIRQLERIRLTIMPLGKPQERLYNIFAYLNKYGDAWLNDLILSPLEVDGVHRIVYL